MTELYEKALEKARKDRDKAAYLGARVSTPGLRTAYLNKYTWLSRLVYLAELGLRAMKAGDGPESGGWISVEERLPEDSSFYLTVVNGQYGSITFEEAVELGAYDQDEGWLIEAWPEWENPGVTHWRPLPELPEGGHHD